MEHENFEEGVSRPWHLATPGGAGVSIFCLRRKYVNLRRTFLGAELLRRILESFKSLFWNSVLSHTWLKWTASSRVDWDCFSSCAWGLRNCGKHASLGDVRRLGCASADVSQRVCSIGSIQ